MSPFWQDIRTFFLDPILRDLESRGHNAAEPHFEVKQPVQGMLMHIVCLGQGLQWRGRLQG